MLSEISQLPWLIVGCVLSLISALILYNLQAIKTSLKDVITEQATQKQEIAAVRAERAACKLECQGEFVQVGQFLRETGYTRKQLDGLVISVNTLSGKMDVVNQMPAIAGSIAASTVKEMTHLIQRSRGEESNT